MATWTRRARLTRGCNLMLLLLLFAALLLVARREDYLATMGLPFAAILAGGLLLGLWLMARVSTARLLALFSTIFLVEVVKESLGIYAGLWSYTGREREYLFGVLAWVVGGSSAFVIAWGAIIPLLFKIRRRAPRWLNLALLLLLFALIPLTVDPAPSGPVGAALWYWSFYAALLALALWAGRELPWQVLAGLVLAAWMVGNPSEFVGSVVSRFWIFTDHPRYPPSYLLAGCWPLEIVAQYVLSGWLAGEPLSGESAPPASGLEQARRAFRQLRVFLVGGGLVYLGVGLLFAIAPDGVLRALNYLSRILTPGLALAGLPRERFWVALAFSMMMTIAMLSFCAASALHRNRGYVAALLMAKATSTLCSLWYFLMPAHHQLASLFIVLVDGTLFSLTLYFFLRAFLRAQTGYYYGELPPPPSSGPTTVAAYRGEDKADDKADDKLTVLDRVLEATGFFAVLERELARSGKQRGDFSVVIKPNFMFMHAKADISTYTDPELVEALVDRIYARGFSRITLVEAQSTYGNYYANRDVLTVAEHVGYHFDRNYRVVDLTQEMVEHDYGGRLGRHVVGRTWRDADFRISFAKNKTHVFCYYTLTLKNVYGALPVQDKLRAYHTKREYDWPTIESLLPRNFPVHFGLIDAFVSADGQFGVIADPKPKPTRTIIGGENLMAVDWVGAKKMGLDPDHPRVGRFYPLAVRALGQPTVEWLGDKSVYPGWRNVSPVFIYALDLIEEAYAFSNWCFSVLTAMDERFPFMRRGFFTLLARKVLAPVKRLLYPHDVL